MNSTITISEALPNEFNIIQDLAKRIWPSAYGSILKTSQIDYMLERFYSLETLNENYEKGHHFLLAREHGKVVGFAAYERDVDQGRAHIHKIYVLPELQGKGIGRKLMKFIEEAATKSAQNRLSLNVNRYNPAQHFYRALGFEITSRVDIEIGNGYLMEDFVMEKTL